MIKTLLLLSTIIVFGFAGDSFMEFWKVYDFAMFFSVLLFIFIMPFWLIFFLFSKGKGNKFFRNIILLDVAVFCFSYLYGQFDQFIDYQRQKPKHHFQESYEYGIYGNPKLLFSENNDSIIDIYFDDTDLSYLTKKGHFITKINRNLIDIDIHSMQPIIARTRTGYDIILMTANKDIFQYDLNVSKLKSINGTYYKLDFTKYYYKSQYQIKKTDDTYQSYYDDLYAQHLKSNDTKDIERIGYHHFLTVVDTQNSKVIFYDNTYPIHEFKLDKKPKLALYNQYKDTLLVVYEKDDSKIYELSNILTKDYTKVQNIIKEIINSAFTSWGEQESLPIDGVNTKDIEQIKEVFNSQKDIDFYYRVNKQKENLYSIDVFSNYAPLINMNFVIKYTSTTKKLISFKMQKRYFKKNELLKLVNMLSESKSNLDALKGLLRLEALISDTSYNLSNQSDVSLKSYIEQEVRKRMYEVFFKNLKIKNESMAKKIEHFKTTLPCIVSYTSHYRDYGGLNSTPPLTQKFLDNIFKQLTWYLKNKCDPKEYKKFLNTFPKLRKYGQ